MPRTAVEELTVDGGAAADRLADSQGGGPIVEPRDRERLEVPRAGSAASIWRLEEARCIFDLAVLDDKDRSCLGYVLVTST